MDSRTNFRRWKTDEEMRATGDFRDLRDRQAYESLAVLECEID